MLRVDGGMTASDYTMQFLADITGSKVDRPTVLETTALGAAWLAGHRAGIYPDRTAFSAIWARDRRFEPDLPSDARTEMKANWDDAVQRTLSRS